MQGLYRYIFGSTILMAIAMGGGWPMSFFLPILTLGYFAPGKTIPSFKEVSSFFVILIASTYLALFFSRYILEYEIVFILAVAVALFFVFYTDKLDSLSKTFLLVNILLVPLVSFTSISLANLVTESLVFNAGLSFLMIWIIFSILPDKDVKENKLVQKEEKLDRNSRFILAVEKFIIAFPLTMLFFYFELLDGLLVLIMAAILLTMPNAGNPKIGLVMIGGNLIGGILAIVIFELFVIVPNFIFMIIVVLGLASFFGRKLYEGSKLSPIFGMVYSTILLILGQSTSGEDSAGSKVWMRVLFIMLAVIYVVGFYYLINLYKDYKKERNNKALSQA